ncbi:MAG: hypothetical protein IJR64_08750 [Bacteroidales bacterium]|nr:hypothetical protein [Bacteroidales bacterium]
MKRIIFVITLVVASMTSCQRYDGTEHFSPTYVSTPLKEYMLCISNDIVTATLEELESALKMDKESTMAKYFYQSNGTSLSADGSMWKVLRDGALSGATITKVSGKQAWTIEFDGKFSFNGNRFDTHFNLTATAVDPSADGHRDWDVEINGNRTEEDDYTCSFNNAETPINYRAIDDAESSWNAFGFLIMEVNKNGNKVDALIMQLRGNIGSVSIARM